MLIFFHTYFFFCPPPSHFVLRGGGFGQIFLLLNIIKNTPALAGWPKELTRKKSKKRETVPARFYKSYS